MEISRRLGMGREMKGGGGSGTLTCTSLHMSTMTIKLRKNPKKPMKKRTIAARVNPHSGIKSTASSSPSLDATSSVLRRALGIVVVARTTDTLSVAFKWFMVPFTHSRKLHTLDTTTTTPAPGVCYKQSSSCYNGQTIAIFITAGGKAQARTVVTFELVHLGYLLRLIGLVFLLFLLHRRVVKKD